MEGNPFYFDASISFLPGLNTLSNTIFRNEELDKETEYKQGKLNEETRKLEEKKRIAGLALEALKTGDADAMAKIVLEHPSIGTTLFQLLDRKTKLSDEEYVDSIEKALIESVTTPVTTPETTPETIPETTPNEIIPDQGTLGFSAFNIPILGQKPLSLAPVNKFNVIQSIKKLNPLIGRRILEFELAKRDPKRYKAWKDIYDPEEKLSDLGTKLKERQKLLDEGYAKDSPEVKAYDRAIWGDKKTGTEVAPSNLQKMMNERDALVEKLIKEGVKNPYEHPDYLAFQRKILGEQSKDYAPSSIKKMAEEREARIKELEEQGLTPEQIENDEIVNAYDMKLTGTDINVKELTPEAIDFWGMMTILTQKVPSVGRGKVATKARMQIISAAAKWANKLWGGNIANAPNPFKAALEAVATSTDTKAIGKSIAFLDQQYASQQSFVTNLNHQIDQIEALSKDLPLVDVRLMNVPIRLLAKKVAGNPELSKYETYLAEIERELSKLASNATQSVSAPTDTEIKRWAEMLDPNLSVKDMLNLLQEIKNLANIRVMSSASALEKARERIRTREYPDDTKNSDQEYKTIDTQEEYDALPSGSYYIDSQTGLTGRKP